MSRKNRSARAITRWSYNAISQIPRDLVGVYAFWCRDNRKCIYVGKAERRPIRDRLRDHWNGSHNETLRLWISEFGDTLDVCFMSYDPARIDKLERRLIRLWHPEANVSGNPNR